MLGEDSAAILGLVIAFIFVALSIVKSNPIYDAIGSISIGFVLIVVSVFVAWCIKALIIGTAAEPGIRARLNEILQQDENVQHLFNVITIQFGSEIMLAAKIKLPDAMPMTTAVEKINLLELRIKKELPNIGWYFIEPDVDD